MAKGKFHVNLEGRVMPCNAQPGKCPFADDESHFTTSEEAQLYADKRNEWYAELEREANFKEIDKGDDYFKVFQDARRSRDREFDAEVGALKAFRAWEYSKEIGSSVVVMENSISDEGEAYEFISVLKQANQKEFVLGKHPGLMETMHSLLQGGSHIVGKATYKNQYDPDNLGIRFEIDLF